MRLSKSELFSVCLITLHSFAVNLVILYFQMKKTDDLEILFSPETPLDKEYRKTQMEKILEEGTIRVAIHKNNAYWVINNVIYKAVVDEEGRIRDDQAEEIDVFKLSEKEVQNLLSIIDSISN